MTEVRSGSCRDVVVTVPKSFGLAEWIDEGDAAGEPWSGDYWSFYAGGGVPKRVQLTGRAKSTAGLVATEPDKIPDNSPGVELVHANTDPDRYWLFCEPDQRCYVVAHGRLRGYSPLYALEVDGVDDPEDEPRRLRAFIRRGDAVAVTIEQRVVGFRGWRYRWWDRGDEMPFPDWRRP